MDSTKPQTLVEILKRSYAMYAERPLFIHHAGHDGEMNPSPTTYGRFARDVDSIRGGLAYLGVARGDVVAIAAGNCVEWAIVAYATYGLGAAFVPMYPTQTAEEWAYIVKDSGASVVFVHNEEAAQKLMHAFKDKSFTPRIIPIRDTKLDALWHQQFADLMKFRPRFADDVSPDELAAIIYTSGTTGNPKGVELTHENIVSNVIAAREVLHIGPDDRTLAFLPWAHAFGHTGELHMVIYSGASTYVCEDPTQVVNHMPIAQPTLLLSVPKVFKRIHAVVLKQIEAKPAPIRALFRSALKGNRFTKWLADKLIFSKVRAKFGGRLKFAISGGAALGRADAEFMAAIGIPVYEGYGLSETSPVVTLNGTDAYLPGSVGKPVPGVRVAIIPCEDCQAGDGEIVVYGPNVMRGYHNLPDETAKVMTADGGFRTGDIGHVDADGYLVITGRYKEQYKLENGKYIVPSPLEDALKASPVVLNAFIYGDNKPYNVALLAVADGTTEDQAQAELERLSADWKPYERIRSFKLVPDFTQEDGLLTPKLSLKRKKVLEKYRPQIDALYAP